jgi:multidrug efflux pump subunit AcrA (membrane-fusion protein)
VAGILTEVRVDKGDPVKRGQVLGIVSDPNLEYACNKASAELEEKVALADPKTSPPLRELDAQILSQKILLEIAQREEKRQQELMEQKASSQMDLDRATERAKTAWAELQSLQAQREAKRLELEREVKVARAARDTAQWNRDLETIRSPIDGVVLDRPASLGTRLAINDHVMQIADVSPEHLVMRAAVDEEDRAKLRDRQAVRMVLYAFADETLSGRVEKIYDRADPEQRTFEVDIRVEPPDKRLHPGMTGELAFIMESKEQAVVVPAQALQQQTIWTVREGVLAAVKPDIGLKSVQRVEVLSGIEPGQRVVISPAGNLTDGQRVRTTYEDPQTAAGLNKPKQTSTFKGFNQ